MVFIAWLHTPFILNRQSVLYQSFIMAKLELKGRCPEKRMCSQHQGFISLALPPWPGAALSSRGEKMGSQTPVKHLCVLQQNPVLIRSAF